jgi:hypothetical protein
LYHRRTHKIRTHTVGGDGGAPALTLSGGTGGRGYTQSVG